MYIGKPGLLRANGRICSAALLVVAVALVVTALMAQGCASVASEKVPAPDIARSAAPSPAGAVGRPRLLEVGSESCMACKAMAEVLDDLRRTHGTRLQVDFVDVRKDEDAATRYGVQMIPTQIFYDAAGREAFRHTGFFGKDQILAKFAALKIGL